MNGDETMKWVALGCMNCYRAFIMEGQALTEYTRYCPYCRQDTTTQLLATSSWEEAQAAAKAWEEKKS